MNRSESKYFNTALLMDQALVELLGQKDLQYISVKEICHKAGVNRSTFYLHYETIGDLLEETLEQIDDRFNRSFGDVETDVLQKLEQAPLDELVFINETYLVPYLEFMYENRAVYRAAINNPVSMKTDRRYANLKKHVLYPIFSRFRIPEEQQNYWAAYYINGIWAILQEWLGGGCRETVPQVVAIIQACVRPQHPAEKAE